MEELVQKYHDEHEVVYEMRAIVDGEVVIKYSSPVGFDDVSSYAWKADQAMYAHITDHYISKSEYELDNKLDAFRDERAY